MKKGVWMMGITLAVYLGFRYVLPLVGPFVLAGVVSMIVYPVMRKWFGDTMLWKTKWRKCILVGGVIVFYLFVFAVVTILGGYICNQGKSIWLNLPFYEAKCINCVEHCCCEVDGILHMEQGESYRYVERLVDDVKNTQVGKMIPSLTKRSVKLVQGAICIFFEVIFSVIITCLLVKDYEKISAYISSNETGKHVVESVQKCKTTLKNYLKAQVFIFLIDACICTVAFILIGKSYSVMWGLGAALFDALPVFGIGLIVGPLALWYLFQKRYVAVLIMAVTYVSCVVVRQLIEPKMIGDGIGIPAVVVIVSMYAGVKLFGVPGFLLGPFGVILGRELYRGLACKYI